MFARHIATGKSSPSFRIFLNWRRVEAVKKQLGWSDDDLKAVTAADAAKALHDDWQRYENDNN